MGWYSDITTGELAYFRQIPKVDLHRHLEGSLRPATLLEIASHYGITLPVGSVNALVQVQPGEPLTFTNFLSKFQILRQFYCDPDVIRRVTEEAVADAAADGVAYLELRFTPVALSRLRGFPLCEVMDWVIDAAQTAGKAHRLPTRLIASVNRHEPVDVAESVARLAADRLGRGVVGLDLAGNEAEFSALPFAGVFREARAAGLHTAVHAGEWGGAENVRQAVEGLGAERIGHGVRVLEDAGVVALLRERGVTLEVCPTSNVQSGAVASAEAHPLARMVRAGLRVTINTDDPGIQGITLSDEFRLAQEVLHLPAAALRECVLNGARSAFLPADEAAELLGRLIVRLGPE